MVIADASLFDEQETEDRWEVDYRRQLFEWAAAAVEPEFNPRIWEAFWRTAVGDEDPVVVGQDLGMSRAAVYVAKCRCVKRLQEKIVQVGEGWEAQLIDDVEKLG